ncbi:hypothetical protein DFH07DRAFT_706856, partial [Mycena maculata]
QIIGVINAVWDTGMYHALQHLPSLFIPNPDSFYRTDCHLDAVRHIKDACVVFLYFTAPALIPYHVTDSDNAYAVAFFIPGADSLQALTLSYVLIRFMDKYIRSTGYIRFDVLDFAFMFDLDGTYGILLLDHRFRKTYRRA